MQFTIKKAGVLEDVSRENMGSKVRYITEDNEGRVINERDIPMGTIKLETVLLCLVSWNIETESGPAQVTKRNIELLLDPEELDFLYEEIIAFNPMWQGVQTKNSSEKS